MSYDTVKTSALPRCLSSPSHYSSSWGSHRSSHCAPCWPITSAMCMGGGRLTRPAPPRWAATRPLPSREPPAPVPAPPAAPVVHSAPPAASLVPCQLVCCPCPARPLATPTVPMTPPRQNPESRCLYLPPHPRPRRTCL